MINGKVKELFIRKKINIKANLRINQLANKTKITHFIARAVIYFLLIDFAFVYLYPFLYMFTESVKSPADVADRVINWIPRGIYVQNYIDAFQSLNYINHLKNSMMLSLLPAMGQIISCSMIGYGFARFKFKGRELFFALAMFTLIIPPQSVIIPLFMQFRTFGMLNSYRPMIIPTLFGAGLKGALFIFIFRNFFRGLPVSLEDAAKIDGCSSLKTFLRIVIPTSQPAILVTLVLSIVWHWNNFFEPYVYLTDELKYPLPMMLEGLARAFDQLTGGGISEGRFGWTLVMAAVCLILAPIIIMYAVLQRKFMQGIATTGLKD